MEELNDTIEQLNLADAGRTCAPADIIPFLSFPLQKNFSVLVFILLDLLAAYCVVTHSSLQHYFSLGFQVTTILSSSYAGVTDSQALDFPSLTPSLSAGRLWTLSSSWIFFLCTLTPLVTPSQCIYVAASLKCMSTGRTLPLNPKPVYSMVTVTSPQRCPKDNSNLTYSKLV